MTARSESPYLHRRRQRPFAQLQNNENQTLAEGIIKLPYGTAVSADKQLCEKPFGRLFAQTNSKIPNVFDLSYSSSLDNTNLDSPSNPCPRTRPFTRRQRKDSGSFFDVSYCSSSLDSTKSIEHVTPLVRSRPFTRSLGKENYNTFGNISYVSSSAENASLNEIPSVKSLPKLFRNNIRSRNKKRSNASCVSQDSSISRQQKGKELLDDISYMSSPGESSVKDLSFKMPRPFKMRLKKCEDESTFDISYKSSEDGSTYETGQNNSENRPKPFNRKTPLVEFFHDLTYISSENDVSSPVHCDSSGSQYESDVMEVDDVQRASMATKEDYFPELHVSKLSNQSIAPSLNLTSESKSEKNKNIILDDRNLEGETEKLNVTDKFDVTDLTNNVSSFILTPCKERKTSTTGCENQQNGKEPVVPVDGEASSFDERQKPFSKRVVMPESAISDVSYNSSKSEVNVSSSNRNLRLFENNRCGGKGFLSNISYNSSIERSNMASINSPQTRAMRKRSLDASRLEISLNDTSIPKSSNSNQQESISVSMKESLSENTDSYKDSSKSNESIPIAKSRPFEKLLNNLESTLPFTSYIASQETPVSMNKPPGVKKLFGPNSCLPEMSFSITYEESVDDAQEKTRESLITSSEESVESSEKSASEDSSSDEEKEEESVEKEECSEIEEVSESVRLDKDSEKEFIAQEVDNQPNEAKNVHEELEMSVENGINSHPDRDEVGGENILDNGGVSSSEEGTINASVVSDGNSKVWETPSFNCTEKTFMTSQNNITVLPEKQKNSNDQLAKHLDFDEFKKVIEEKIACVREKAIEKVKNKHRFSYQESPSSAKKKYSKKKVATIKKYPRPKLFKPAHWANKRLYDFLSKCLEYKGLNRMLEAEKIVKMLHETIQLVTHSKIYQKNAIQRLKVELANQKIIVTTFDFYSFVRDYLPGYFEEKVIPCVQPYTNTVWPPKDNIKESDPIIM